ncbi:MAG: carboxypeptidase regulatory-like domain-containing protein [Desulfobacterales bacterium]|nr:carboxypeptidase regulatory-like domain-containing protein [Desulfobacterales bacterium]
MDFFKKYKMSVALPICVLTLGLFMFGCSENNEDVEAANPNNPALSLKGTIQGLVVSATGEPVSGVEASMAYDENDNGKADTVICTTDAAGHYNFQNVPVSGSQDVPGTVSTITINDPDGTYVTAHTLARLVYQDLVDAGQIAEIGGEDQAVGDLMVEAITVTARRPNVDIVGKVQNLLTGEPIEGASIVICENVARLTHNIPLNYAETDGAGEFTIADVPESSGYVLTITAAGYGTLVEMGPVLTPVGPTTVYADAVANDGIVATAWQLQPGAPTPDTTAPYAVSTNIPRAGVIPTTLAEGPFTVTWSEPMDISVGTVNIDTTGFRAPVPLSLSWDEETAKVLTITPTQAIPEGMNVQFTFAGFTDVSENAHTGLRAGIESGSPGNSAADAISVWTDGNGNDDYDAGEVAIGFATATQGDPTLIEVANLIQVVTPDDLGENRGGPAANCPQANNNNVLDQFGAIGIGTLGDGAGEADTISLSWDAAEGARQYRVYAELNTGGFTNGLPVFIDETPKSGNPDNEIEVTLTEIDDEIVALEAATLDNLPNVDDANMNGTLLFFNNGFNTIQMAVTAVNTENIEGGFSNVVSVQDVTAPVVADQANYVAGAGFGFDADTDSPLYVLTDSATGGGTAATTTFNTIPWDDDGLDDVTGGTSDDGAYDAADWTAYSKLATLTIGMNEDLDTAQTVTPTLTTGSTATITSAVIPGVGDSRKDINVVISDVTVLATDDTISFVGVLDEAGNAAPSDFTAELVLDDQMGPFITSAVTDPGTATNDILTITFQEPVDETTAETIGSYAISAGGPITGATLDAATNTVTLTAAEGNFVALTGGTLISAFNVEDEAGNTFADLFFLIDDQIPAVVTAAADGVGGINDGAPAANANDDAWEVGDATGIETYQVTLTFSENVFAAPFEASAEAVVAVSASPSATYLVDSADITNVVIGATSDTLTIEFFLKAGQTVAAGDSLSITYTDAGGLPGTAKVTLGAAGAGVTITNN